MGEEMDGTYLTVKELAELCNCSERWIRKKIESGVISADEVSGQTGGQNGTCYRIPLASLDDKLKLRYKRLKKRRERDAANADAAHRAQPETDYESLSGEERQMIEKWKKLILDWRVFRNSHPSKESADDDFIKARNLEDAGLNLTRRTLYRKWKDFIDRGEAALVDRRGKHVGHKKKLDQEMWDIFEYYYLDQSQKGIPLCMTLTELELRKRESPLAGCMPSLTTFSRRVKDIPVPFIEYFRHGEKDFIDKCAPYISRIYENLESNDIWVADNHTFDIMLFDGEKPFRAYLTAFMDVRSRKMTGWAVTDRPCGDATLFAFRKGIEKCGVPRGIYTDNGREFLFHDFGGNGFRKKAKDKNSDADETPTILKQLGVEFRTALPRNARAKGIERAFDTVKESFSKLFEAYTSGNVTQKPDRLKLVVRDFDRLKKVEEFIGYVDTYIEGWYNKQPHRGEGMDGKTPDEVWNEYLIEKTVATEAQLNLMFMRWSNPMKVGKNGVTLTFYGKKLQYSSEDLWANHFGEQVFVRYNPDDLREVRIYGRDERFICTAALDKQLGYNATKEEIAKAQREKRSTVKAVTGYKKMKGIQAGDELEAILNAAAENLENGIEIDPKVLRPIYDDGSYLKAAGDEYTTEVIDWTSALKNLKKKE